MNRFPRWMPLIAMTLAWSASTIAATVPPAACASWPKASRDLRQVLAQRAIDAASLASRAGHREDVLLNKMVSDQAVFDLGAGDVGRPLGNGLSGLRRLVLEMHADRYRYDSWNYMSNQEDPCGAHEVAIEFSDSTSGSRAEVTFKFIGGVILEGKGWVKSSTTGAFPAVQGFQKKSP